VSGSGLGILLLGMTLPRVIEACSWRCAWFMLAAGALGVGVVAALLLRNHPEEMGLQPLGGPVEASQSRPGPWYKLLWEPTLWHLASVYFLCGLSYIVYVTFFTTYLVREVGLSSVAAGRLWAVTGAVSIGAGLLWGFLSDRLGRRLALIAVLTGQALSFLLFANPHSPWAIYLSILLYGLTSGSTTVVVASMAADYFGPRLSPAALGLCTTVFSVGQALGPSLAGSIVDRTGTFHGAWLLVATAAALGAAVAALLPRPRAVLRGAPVDA